MPASKDIVMRYFVQEADNLWKCSCGKVLSQKKNTGFTNLFNHINMVVETSFTAQQHMEHLEFVLQLYGKTMHENVIAIIGDNCETMKCLANLCSVPLVGCASHRFNLAVNKYMEYQDHMSVLNKINGLMGKLKNLKLAGKLRKYTKL